MWSGTAGLWDLLVKDQIVKFLEEFHGDYQGELSQTHLHSLCFLSRYADYIIHWVEDIINAWNTMSQMANGE